MTTRPGLVEPAIEELLSRVDSKFTLVSVAARRARQINSYYQGLSDGLGRLIPPQVSSLSAKPLSIALEEIVANAVTYHRTGQGPVESIPETNYLASIPLTVPAGPAENESPKFDSWNLSPTPSAEQAPFVSEFAQAGGEVCDETPMEQSISTDPQTVDPQTAGTETAVVETEIVADLDTAVTVDAVADGGIVADSATVADAGTDTETVTGE